MRLLVRVVFVCLFAASAQAQSVLVTGPSLGFTSEAHGTAIRSIIGIPGASALGNRIPLDIHITAAAISPKQTFALAVRTEDAQLVLVDLRGSAPVIASIDAKSRVESIAFSPGGSVAALYGHQTRTVQVIGNLPDAPELIQEFDVSQIPGSFRNVAVSDDGSSVLFSVAGADKVSIWVLDATGAQWPVQAEQPTAAAFFPQSSDAIVADTATQSAFIIKDVRHAASLVPLVTNENGLGSFAAVSASPDGQSVYLADRLSGTIAVVDMATRRAVTLSCDCQASAFNRLKGSSVFRLTEASREPMLVLDASSAEPRIVIVPPRASDEEGQQ
jgi:WD40 repeat protein